MLGVRSVSGLAFYDWDSTELIRRIEITPKNVSYYTSGNKVVEGTMFLLHLLVSPSVPFELKLFPKCKLLYSQKQNCGVFPVS